MVINTRLYSPEDGSALARLFCDTVRLVNSADYSKEQIESWIGATLPGMARWRDPVSDLIVLVSDSDSEIVGFIAFEPNGHLVYLFVHHLHQRQGIASALIARLEAELGTLGTKRIFTEASITARTFFEGKGFRVIGSKRYGEASCLFYLMEKYPI